MLVHSLVDLCGECRITTVLEKFVSNLSVRDKILFCIFTLEIHVKENKVFSFEFTVLI